MKREEIKKIMKETCWGLAYCCKSPCPARDKVMKELGLSKEQFSKLKRNFDKELFKLLEGGKHGKGKK